MAALMSSAGKAAAAALLMAAATAVPIAWAELRPRSGDDVAVVFPLWTDREQAFARIAAAGGRPVRAGAIDAIVVVKGEGPGLIERLYDAGAWAVIDPLMLGGCLVRPPWRKTDIVGGNDGEFGSR